MILPVVVQAQFTCTTNNGEITITEYTGPGGAVNIPATINGLPVTRIGPNAFMNNVNVASLTIEDGVKTIDSHAFIWCTSPAVLPPKVIYLGSGAFENCFNLSRILFRGNVPGPDVMRFAGDELVTIYYLPGTTGWGAMFEARPAVLWNPQFDVGNANFGIKTNQFSYNITGTTNIPIVLETCGNFAAPAWEPLHTCTLTNGEVYFNDPDWANYPARFYRIRWP